jgi:hypothetical protein
MAQIVPVYFAPDLDNAWSVAPGAMARMTAFAPLQSGAYGSMGSANLFGSSFLTGTDILKAKTFRQVAGTVRLLAFRNQNIDEYDNAATRTNRGTGYNASTANWQAAAWGNQIIACNYLDATQSSTGAGFSGLGGSSPKARYIASNLDFVMLADVDDGGSNVYSDMVWWGGLRNPATWTPSLSTQAGNQRLLEVPGPIRGIVAYRNSFVVFKDNAVWVGEYVGGPPQGFIFAWRVVSSKIGCIAPDSIVELDGKLYWMHSSGFYEFDGQTIRAIGLPVFQSFQVEGNYATYGGARYSFIGTNAVGMDKTQAVVDDLEGVVWFQTAYSISIGNTPEYAVLYGYNVRSQKWGRHLVSTGENSSAGPRMVSTNYADMQAFKADKTGRMWMVWNDLTTGTTLRSLRYPVATTDSVPATYTTGVFGSVDGSDLIDKHYIRTLDGTTSDTGITFSVAGYTSENKLVTNGTNTGTYNSEFDEGDVRLNSRFKTVATTWTAGKVTILGGVGFNGKPGGKR